MFISSFSSYQSTSTDRLIFGISASRTSHGTALLFTEIVKILRNLRKSRLRKLEEHRIGGNGYNTISDRLTI